MLSGPSGLNYFLLQKINNFLPFSAPTNMAASDLLLFLALWTEDSILFEFPWTKSIYSAIAKIGE